jgi:hypothetical protein
MIGIDVGCGNNKKAGFLGVDMRRTKVAELLKFDVLISVRELFCSF